ncbi:MAG: ParB N-terminal domain-containing protein [Archangium sp.]|nr:ParB N-terminal domain-containing protein [Archangium sp.]MDP3156470.1 ParB N-terminal domain-containing protein [Archangium sp.]MDP3571661.1 ParB N-terminal domain-containing protein [Archangium sp.]
MAAKKIVKKPKAARRKKVEAKSKGLGAKEMSASLDGLELARLIESDGGTIVGSYKEPLGGKHVVIAALPIDKVEPTPYQRDRSEAHVKKLANAMERVGRFLDPIIAVRKDGQYWTPNGNHRLGAAKLLGLKSIVALVIPEEDVAFQILALNTEKAHNLKERSLEVIRMLRGLVGAKAGNESDYIGFFEEPHFITFGAAYEKRPRFSAGAYTSVVKRLEGFLDEPVDEALASREARADHLLKWDDEVVRVVEALKARGLQSPYLKNYVVARVNFLRFKKDGEFEFDETIQKMIDATRKIDPSKVNKDDLAKMGGAPAAEAEE